MKKKFFIDFDNTIIDTTDAFCSVYNEFYLNHPNFKTAEPDQVKVYNFSDECRLVTNVEEIFTHPLFFQFAQFINSNTYETLEKLNNKYELIVCSIGWPKNLAYKALWLEKKIPFIKDYVLISNPACKMNKSIVNMQDSVFLDDIPSNLDSSNADRKILFGKRYSWNNEWQGEWHANWSEVEERLL
jgi:5'(3')-deoxyribonucleotidase